MLADREMLEKATTRCCHACRRGIPVWLETRYAAAHNKVLLIDVGEADGRRHHRQLQFHLVGAGAQCREPADPARQSGAGAALSRQLATASRRGGEK
jgi:hypothetical protein